MGLKIEMNYTVSHILKLAGWAGVPQWQHDYVLSAESTSIVLRNPQYEPVGTLHFKPYTLTLLTAGKLGKVGTNLFIHALSELLQGLPPPAMTIASASAGEPAKAKAKKPAAQEPIPVPPPVADLPKGKVPLIDAVALLQKVNGTDTGSIYRVIAIGDGIAVAARLKGANVSFRVEGAKLDDYAASLSASGLSQASPQHWSLHVAAGDKILARKTVGAMLFSLGVEFTKAVTDLSKLEAG